MGPERDSVNGRDHSADTGPPAHPPGP